MKIFLGSILIFTLGIVIYSLTIRGIYGNLQVTSIKNNLDQATKPFELSPERGRFILTFSLAENKSFSLSRQLADAADPDVGYHEGKFFIFFPPGISVLGLPLYILGKPYNLSQIGTFFTITIFAVLNLLLIYKISNKIFKLPVALSLLSSLIFGFASTSWSYAITFYQHHVTTFAILSVFYSTFLFKKVKKWNWIFAGYNWIIYGLALFLDYPNLILLAPVMVYFILNSFNVVKNLKKIFFSIKTQVLITSLLFIATIVVHGYYNQVNFGSWKKVSGSLAGIKKVKEQEKLKNLNKDKILDEISSKKDVTGFFEEDDLPRGFAILLFSRDRGLFLYTPIFVLALLGIYALRKKINLETGILLGVVGVNLFLYSSWGDPWGGWAYGPRYLIPSMAVLSIFIGIWLNNTKHKIISKLATFILFTYSCFIALLGALTTSQVPPKVEADFLKMKYNFLLNWDYFITGRSGSFVFNEYASKYMTLQQYFAMIYLSLILIVLTLLFIVPLFENREQKVKV